MQTTIAGIGLVVAAVIGCASIPRVANAQAEVAAPAPAKAPAQKSSREIIARTDLEARASSNLYEIVMSMRSQWLRGSASARSNMSITSRETSGGGFMQDPDAAPRTGVGAGGASTTQVYVDGRRFGAITSLRTMPAESAEKLCYFPVNKAQNRFGMQVETPVIEVFTRGSSYAETDC